MGTAVLLITCPDRPGLVAGVSEFIHRHGGNILHADQHVDQEKGLFLQRVEWDLAGFDLPSGEIGQAFRPLADRFGMDWTLHLSDERVRLAVLASRLPHCLYDLLVRWRLGELRGEVELVLSNHPDLEPIAAEFGVEYRHVPIAPETKAEREGEMLELLRERGIDGVVLARYMQILGPMMVDAYRNRVINIHHSFLPAFSGADPYRQAYERGVKIIGATAHYVTEELDAGPIIEQDVVRVSHRDTVDDMVRKGRELEKVVLARALRLHLERRVLTYGNKTVVFD